MQTRDAVEAMMAIMKNEQMYGRSDYPVWIERTAVGSSVQALLQGLTQLDIGGEIAGRVMQRMAEVLEGRHTDDEILHADVMQWRDFAHESPEHTRRRVTQHTLFVQIDGTNGMMSHLLLNIGISPTAYAPTGAGARILHWAQEQQDEMDKEMVGTDEKTMELPDIKLEGYEFLFTEHLHRVDLDHRQRAASKGAKKAADDDGGLDQTTAEGQVVASAFRVLLALLRYGTTNTKEAVLREIRNLDMLRSLICLADDVTNGLWYPANVGTNLLLIMQDLCTLPLSQVREDSNVVLLYDMITIMLRSTLAMFEPKLDAVMRASRSMGERVRHMSEQEELLLRNVALTYGVMCETIGQIQFSDSLEVNTAVAELALQRLMAVKDMRVLIKYLYYENLLAYLGWSATESAATHGRAATVREVTRLLAEHLCANEDTRWEMLETITRYEVVDRLALRPSFVQTLLMLVQRRIYERSLQVHLAERKIFPDPERVLVAHWARLEPTKRRRLFVVTNRAYYMLREPLGDKCTVCSADKFCPNGPDIVQRFAFRDVKSLAIGFSGSPAGPGQRARIQWARHRVTLENPAKNLQFSLLPLGVADKIVNTIHKLFPLARPPPIEPDLTTLRVLKEKLLAPDRESVLLYLQVEKLVLGSGKVLPRVCVLSTLSLYIFVEDPAYFLVDPLLTAAEKRAKNRKDGNKLLQEDEKFRLDGLLEVDFIAGDQSVVAMRFVNGNTQLRFGDDFALQMLRQQLRALLPEGLDQWKRKFGRHDDEEKAARTEQAHEGEGEESEEGEEGEEGHGGEGKAEHHDEPEDPPDEDEVH